MEQREQAHKGTWGRGDWVWLSRWGGCPVRGSPEAPAVVFLPLRPARSQQVSWLAEPQGHVRSERASRISSRGEPGTIVHCWKGKWAVLGSRVPGSIKDQLTVFIRVYFFSFVFFSLDLSIFFPLISHCLISVAL